MTITAEQFIKTLKTGSCWLADQIAAEITTVVDSEPNRWANHSLCWDSDDKFHYIWDNHCYLFIFDDKIILRCDRDNVFSSDTACTIQIKNRSDIASAYQHFKSMTMEDTE